MTLWKLKLFLFLDHKFYAFLIPPKIIRLLAVSLFNVREQMWIIKKTLLAKYDWSKFKKRHTLNPSSMSFCAHFLLLTASLLAACECYPGNLAKKRLLAENDTQ